jgi:hypothetical protein
VVDEVVQSQGNQELQNSHHGQPPGHVEADNPGIDSFFDVAFRTAEFAIRPVGKGHAVVGGLPVTRQGEKARG